MRFRRVRGALAVSVLATVCAGVWEVPAAHAALPSECQQMNSTDVECDYGPGTTGTFTVPDGITWIQIQAYGGNGAAVGSTPGGKGSAVIGSFDVTPGQQFVLAVATDAVGSSGATGGGGDAGPGGGGGGGASSVRDGAGSLVMVAAGGGGAGGAYFGTPGGAGGDAPQGNWTTNDPAVPRPGASGQGIAAGGGGGAGSDAAGGAGGSGPTGETGTAGAAVQGGTGGSSAASTGGDGGGGGSGYFGGGGGANGDFSSTGGGGGGGSNLVPPNGFVGDRQGMSAPGIQVLYSTFAITSGPPPDGQVGQAYDFQITTNGDATQAVQYDVYQGSLPPGLSLDSTSGVISGTPTTAGASTFSLYAVDVTGFFATAQYTVTIADVVPAPAASASPSVLSFGSHPVGSTSPAYPATLSNTGNAPLTVSGVAIAGGDSGDFDVTSDACAGAVLAPGESCDVFVALSPTAAGTRQSTLAFTDDAADSPQTVTLKGEGTAPAATVSPSSLSFGTHDVGTTSAPQTVTLSNTGSAPLAVSAVTVGGTDAGDFATSSDTCTGQTVQPGSSCTVGVQFSPSAGGSRVAALGFYDNAAGSPQTVALSGDGHAVASGTVSPSSVSFGEQTIGSTSSTRTLTLTSTGNAPLAVTGVTVEGANAGDFVLSSDTCTGHAIAPGAGCTVDVSFAPSATGTRSATVRFADNAADSPQSVALTGQGVAPADVSVALGASPNTVKNGSQLVYTITVTNGGPATATAVQLTDAIPANTQFVSIQAPSPWSCTTPPAGSIGTVSCTAPALAAGVTTTVKLTVKVVASNKSTVTDTAQVSSQSADPQPANNSATVTTTVGGGKA